MGALALTGGAIGLRPGTSATATTSTFGEGGASAPCGGLGAVWGDLLAPPLAAPPVQSPLLAFTGLGQRKRVVPLPFSKGSAPLAADLGKPQPARPVVVTADRTVMAVPAAQAVKAPVTRPAQVAGGGRRPPIQLAPQANLQALIDLAVAAALHMHGISQPMVGPRARHCLTNRLCLTHGGSPAFVPGLSSARRL